MATTLTIIRTTPHSVQFEVKSTDNTLVYLRKSGATGADVNISSLAMGPLRACLQANADWTLATISDRIIFRRIYEYNIGSLNSYTTPVTGGTATPDLVVELTNNTIGFGSATGAIIASFELRYIPSNQR